MQRLGGLPRPDKDHGLAQALAVWENHLLEDTCLGSAVWTPATMRRVQSKSEINLLDRGADVSEPICPLNRDRNCRVTLASAQSWQASLVNHQKKGVGITLPPACCLTNVMDSKL